MKKLPYLEISSKANYKTKELLLGIVRVLMGESPNLCLDKYDVMADLCRTGIQLTGEIEFEKATAEVDEERAEAAMKEYAAVTK